MSPAEKKLYDLEKSLENIAFERGWSVDELIDNHLDDLEDEVLFKVSDILKEQSSLIEITHPHLRNVVCF